jgi:hypothetical protein
MMVDLLMLIEITLKIRKIVLSGEFRFAGCAQQNGDWLLSVPDAA